MGLLIDGVWHEQEPAATRAESAKGEPGGAGGAYFRIYPYALTRWAFRSINREGRPAVFYLHPWEIDPDHPRIPLPRRIALTHYYNLKRTEPRLKRLLSDFRFAPMKEVLSVG